MISNYISGIRPTGYPVYEPDIIYQKGQISMIKNILEQASGNETTQPKVTIYQPSRLIRDLCLELCLGSWQLY